MLHTKFSLKKSLNLPSMSLFKEDSLLKRAVRERNELVCLDSIFCQVIFVSLQDLPLTSLLITVHIGENEKLLGYELVRATLV